MSSAEDLQALVDCLDEPLFVVTTAGAVLAVNRAGARIFGAQRKALLDDGLKKIWPGLTGVLTEEGEAQSEISSALGKKTILRVFVQKLPEDRVLIRVPQGGTRWAAVNFHAQRLETLGVLAGGVAHDFNNVLAGILGHITYLQTVLPATGKHVESLAAIAEGGKKASGLTQQILNFSRLDNNDQPAKVNLGDLVVRMSKLLRGAISPEFALKTTVPEEPVVVLASEAHLAQVLANLVINARDALGPEGSIEVMVRTVKDPAELRALWGEDSNVNPMAELLVRDNGKGIPEEIVDKIFEPYFSTKKDRGTGLGLSTVMEIVRQLGGRIRVDSVLGRGTSIFVYLPVVATSGKTAKTAGSKQLLPRGAERILVIDDESPVRDVLTLSLEHLGYSVTVASSGVEGLEIFKKNGAAFDLVILDILMPQLSGEEVLENLRKISPQLRVLLISGYSSEEVIKRMVATGNVAFIQKPFTIEELAQNVRMLLDAPLVNAPNLQTKKPRD